MMTMADFLAELFRHQGFVSIVNEKSLKLGEVVTACGLYNGVETSSVALRVIGDSSKAELIEQSKLSAKLFGGRVIHDDETEEFLGNFFYYRVEALD